MAFHVNLQLAGEKQCILPFHVKSWSSDKTDTFRKPKLLLSFFILAVTARAMTMNHGYKIYIYQNYVFELDLRETKNGVVTAVAVGGMTCQVRWLAQIVQCDTGLQSKQNQHHLPCNDIG